MNGFSHSVGLVKAADYLQSKGIRIIRMSISGSLKDYVEMEIMRKDRPYSFFLRTIGNEFPFPQNIILFETPHYFPRKSKVSLENPFNYSLRYIMLDVYNIYTLLKDNNFKDYQAISKFQEPEWSEFLALINDTVPGVFKE